MAVDVQLLKEAARGRWAELLADLGRIDPTILDGGNYPCPKCGGKDRFRFTNMDGDGSIYCNQCAKGIGDGIAALQWVLGWSFAPIKLIADHLGLEKPASNGKPRIVATYDYRDEQGQLLFQVCRREPGADRKKKDFRLRRPKAGGGWVWNIKGVRMVPYRLQELLAARSERGVLVAEGEKDVNRAVSIGLVATTCAMGAGKWRPEYNDHFRGQSVYIVPDNDKPGRDHANQVAQSLYGIAKRIKVVELRSVPEKGDLSDWLDQGHTKAELIELVKAVPEWKPGTSNATAPGEWPEIEPFDQRDLPEFPAAALPSTLRDWVEAESYATQTPADLAGLLALAVCSAAIARRVEVEPRPGWREPVNLFVAVLLEPGNRKSAVFADAKQPLQEIEAELIEAARVSVARAQSERRQDEARLHKLEKQAAEKGDAEARREAGELSAELAEQPEPVLPRLIVDDVTSEKLGMMLAEQDGRIASMSPEGGVFDLMAGLYSKSGIPQFGVYLMGHSGDDLITDRVSRKAVRVERPALTCAYAIQPQVIEGLAENVAFRGRGLLARFLYAAPRSWIGQREIAPPPVSDVTREAYHRTVRDLFGNYGNAKGKLILGLTSDAITLLRDWEDEVEGMLDEGGVMEIMRDWGAKLAGATLRIAAVLHCVEYGPVGEIGQATIAAAVEIARYLIPHAEATMSLMQAKDDAGDDNARYVLRWIERHGRREFTKSEAQHHGKRRFPKAEDIDAPLAELTKRGYIRLKPAAPAGPGRPPSPAYEVNPAAFENETPEKRSQYSRNSSGQSENVNSGNSGSALQGSPNRSQQVEEPVVEPAVENQGGGEFEEFTL